MNLVHLGKNKQQELRVLSSSKKSSNHASTKQVHYLRISHSVVSFQQSHFFVLFGGLLFSIIVFFLLFQGGMRFTNSIHEEIASLRTIIMNIKTNIPTNISDFEKQKSILEQRISTFEEKFMTPRVYFPNSYSPLTQGVRTIQIAREMVALIPTDSVKHAAFRHIVRDMKELDKQEFQERYADLLMVIQHQWAEYWYRAAPHIETMTALLSEEKENYTKTYMENLAPQQLYEAAHYITEAHWTIQQGMSLLPKLLGQEDAEIRYMIVLQNSNERRATGGFIGSVLFVTLQKGWIKQIEWKDSYVIDQALTKFLPPPPGLEYINTRFSFRDGNYWPDFPTSARQLIWFAEQAGMGKVDVVIAVHDQSVASLLEMMHVHTIPGYQTQIPSSQLATVLSLLVESKRNRDDPKAFLFQLGNEYVRQFQKQITPDAIAFFLQEIAREQIIFYAKDVEVQTWFDTLGVTGARWKDDAPKAHHMMMVSTNVGGNKSDAYLLQEVQQYIEKDAHGKSYFTFMLKRSHLWDTATEEKIYALAKSFGIPLNEPLVRILGKGDHRDALRLYLPADAQVSTVEGMAPGSLKIYKEFGYTVVHGVVVTPTSSSKTYKVVFSSQSLEKDRELDFQLPPGNMAIPYQVITTFSDNRVAAIVDGITIPLQTKDTAFATEMVPMRSAHISW